MVAHTTFAARQPDVIRTDLTAGLVAVVALLAAAASAAGLLWPALPLSQTTFTSVHGDVVALFGHGLYRFNSRLIGAGFLGQDIVTLALAAPLLVWSAWKMASAGGWRWLVVRTALLAYVLYVYATMSLGSFYNELFLLYVASFSASIFAFALTLSELYGRLHAVWRDRSNSVPAAAPAIVLAILGVFTALMWASPLVAALLGGRLPALDHATTKITEALDLAIIVPTTLVAAALIVRHRVEGYILAVPLLGLIAMLLPTVAAATASQLMAGIAFTPAEIAGPIGGFLVFGLAGALVLVRLATAVDPAGAAPSSVATHATETSG